MSLRRLGPALVVGVLLFSFGSAAKAQWGFGGYGFGGGGAWVNGTYTMDPPPYFSIFPPVYYSHVTPRPYGFSPYAYPGFMPTPERIRMPSTPYVQSRRQAKPTPASTNTARGPIIKNPFVLPENEKPVRVAEDRPMPESVTAQ